MIDVGRLAASLRQHEGVRLHLYYDTAIPPRATIGCGRNLTDRGISQDESDLMLRNDITEAQRACLGFSWYLPLDTVRQNVICELVFNMGAPRLGGFLRMIAAIRSQDWHTAASELLNSTWAVQVGPARAEPLAQMLQTGIWV